MYWFGVYLIYAAVVMRALVWYRTSPYYILVLVLLAAYGLLLILESPIERRLINISKQYLTWFRIFYLVVQAAIIACVLIIPPLNDFGGMLFIPISLQSVIFFQRRIGFSMISLFTIFMAVILIRGGENFPGGLVMAILFGGICILAGNFALLIIKSDRTQQENQRMLAELQNTNHQLESYAIEIETLAAERERNRLAREMHDSVTQTVFSMNLALQSARLLLNKNRDLVFEQLDRIQELANQAMSEIKLLISHLQPEFVAEQGLTHVLEKLITEKRRLDDLKVIMECSGEVNLSRQVVDCLAKIVQEALTNVVKHAGTQQAYIRINLSYKPFFLEIEDQGRGFRKPSESKNLDHLGLTGMSERAREIGWSLSIDSQPGRGTLVRVEERTA